MRILLVDDNELNRDMLSRRLARRGYHVTTAVDGAECLASAHAAPPDLILLDMSLPVVSGWQAAGELKADPRTSAVPVIALTAHSMAGDEERSLAAGGDDYDTKSIEFVRLLGKIEALLTRDAGPSSE
jgi:two-component system, cell cycle response regulator DivK